MLTDFSFFESIITYSIDNQNEEYPKQSTLISEIGLNESVFFEKMYVSRPKVNEIINFLHTSINPILVYGFPGTGKTTIIHFAVNEFLKNDETTPYINFDFKGVDNISYFTENFDIETWHEDKLSTKTKKILSQRGISDYQVVDFFLKEENDYYEMSPDFEATKRDLFNEFSITDLPTDFYPWIHEKIKAHLYANQFETMIHNLRSRDYLFFLASLAPQKVCVLLYDNLDNITSNEIRDSFYRYIRQYSCLIKGFCKLIITSRTSSITEQTLADYGALDWNKIQIDYKEFIDPTLFEKRVNELKTAKGFCNQIDRLQIMLNLEYSAIEDFSKKIITKRTKYFESIINLPVNQINPNLEGLEIIKEFYLMILNNRNIHSALLNLSNLDRHWMFRHLANFIKYMTNDLNLKLSDLGDSYSEQSFVLESYFYHWSIENEKINCREYDLVQEILDNINKDQIGCSLTHLIFAVIYNLTNRERGHHNYSSKAYLSEVVQLICELGYTPSEVKSRIFNLIKKEDKYLGFLETSKYFSIINSSDLGDNLLIWLTPKAAFICEYLGYKFLYMVALLRLNKVVDAKGEKFDFEDQLPLSTKNISVNLDFLCKIAASHLLALSIIKEKLKDRGNWYVYYKRYFCINDRYSTNDSNIGNFQLSNILKSHVKFLEHQRTIPTYEFISEEAVNQYKLLLSIYSLNVQKIKNDAWTRSKYSFQTLYQEIKEQIDWKKIQY